MVNLMERQAESIQWVHSQGREILWAEFLQKSEEEALSMMESLVSELSRREERSVLLLADLNRASFFSAVALRWQDHQALIHSKCGKIAVVGAHQVIAWTAKAFIHLSGKAGWNLEDKVGFFDYSDQAVRWLIHTDSQGLAAGLQLAPKN